VDIKDDRSIFLLWLDALDMIYF